MVEELDDLREIKLRCPSSGLYSRWVLTEARGNTFAEVEMGTESAGLGVGARLLGGTISRRRLRDALERTLDGLQRLLARRARRSIQSSQ